MDSAAVPDGAQEEVATVEPTMSKNQLKRQKRLERKLERRKEARVLEKARKKEKRKLLKEQGLGEQLKKRKVTKMADSECALRIVVDMAYQDVSILF